MRVLVIAGHGEGDPGAVSRLQGREYQEARETRNLAAVLLPLLRQRGVDAAAYPAEKNAFARRKDGLPELNGADFVLELHFNAAVLDAGNGRAKGTECWVPVGTENTTPARAVCRAMAALGFPDRGVKEKNFAVIAAARDRGIPAVLLEVCFLDDADDMALYDAERAARAICDGLCQGLGIPADADTARKIVQERAGLSDATMEYLAAYQWGADLLRKLAAAMSAPSADPPK